MALETLNEQIDIRNLSIEPAEQQPDLPFNPAKDIPTADWEWIKEEMRMELVTDTDKFLHYATRIALIQPEQNQFWETPEYQKEVFGYIRKENRKLSDPMSPMDFDSMITSAAQAKLLFPDQFNKLQFPKDIKEPAMFVRGFIEQLDYPTAAERLLEIAILAPAKIKFYTDKQEMFDLIAKNLKKAKLDTDSCALLLAMSKIIYGSERTAQLGEYPKLWDDLKGYLFNARLSDDCREYLDHALIMTILSAPEVAVTDTGLHISLGTQGASESAGESSQSLPASRKF